MMEFAGLKDGEPPREFTDQLHEAFTRAVLQSPSWLVVFQITDVFGMTARFNTPGSVAATNWSYRLPHTVKELDEDPVLLEQTQMFSRLAQESGRRELSWAQWTAKAEAGLTASARNSRRMRGDRRRQFLKLGELDAEILRAALQVVPGKCAGEFGLELVAQRHGVVVIQQDEVIADRQFAPGLQDEPMFDGAGDRAHVHDFVGADDGFSLCGHNVSVIEGWW